ncbi:MAG: hypothetical protein J6X70_08030 [Muribaculaceae bacterium]|nr:hypothetical protein [Muribaculaceae bacterium]
MKKALLLLMALFASLSVWAGEVTLTEDTEEAEGTPARWYVNMPAGNQESSLTLSDATITTFKVYDDGGKNGKYSNSCRSRLFITAPTGYVIQLSGRIKTETGWDKLTVHDGNDTSAPILLDNVNGNNSTWITVNQVKSSGQSMTLYFYSDGSGQYDGFDLTAEIFNPDTYFGITVNSADNGSVESSKLEAKADELITLTATPANGYVLSGLSAKDKNNNDIAVDWITYVNTAFFTMPASDVTVTPTFSDDPEVTGDTPYVNMPTTGTKTITVPEGLMSFKVYDDGGKNGYNSTTSNGYLTLTAPEGYNLRVSGTIAAGGTNTYDHLSAYDGTDNTAPILINGAQSSNWYRETAVPTVTSTGQSITLWFYGSNSGCDGLDLTVELVSIDTPYSVTVVNPDEGGEVTADPTTAVVNQTVTLTYAPTEGYVLNNLVVTDVNNNELAVTDMLWYAGTKTGTFTMPASAVTVMPSYTNDLTNLHIDMLKTGVKTAFIPSSVASFKVYDDGGSEGRYSFSCDGTLVMTAPEGYKLQLSGNIMTSQEDYLTVYDNNEASGNKLLDAAESTDYYEWTAIPTVTSTGQSMTLYFYSDSSAGITDGLDLTVTLVSPAVTTSYVDSDGESHTVQAIPLDETMTSLGEDGQESWYVASGTLNYTETLNIAGDVHLILANGAVMNIGTEAAPVSGKGIDGGEYESTLTIYGQSLDDDTAGHLNINTDDDCIYIDGDYAQHSGNVTANSTNSSGVVPWYNFTFTGGTLYVTAKGNALYPDGIIDILGGKLSAIGGHLGINTYTGTVTFGWKNIDDEFTVSKIAAPVKIVDGQAFTDGENIYDSTTPTEVFWTLTNVTLRPVATFAISLPESFEHGTVICDKQTAYEGQTVTLTVTPDNGYELKTLTVTIVDANTSDGAPMRLRGGTVELTEGENGTYTFAMPAQPVTVNATFKKKVPTAIDEINADSRSGQRYNLMGQPVGKDYRGIVIEDCKKLIVK